jgi:hypothetical protein
MTKSFLSAAIFNCFSSISKSEVKRNTRELLIFKLLKYFNLSEIFCSDFFVKIFFIKLLLFQKLFFSIFEK